jgi:rhodanese-related sulfurtransferase
VAAGWPDVWQLKGGIEAWRKAGFPVVGNAKAPISIMRQVQIAAGSIVLVGVVLGMLVSPWMLGISAFVGAGLVFSGASGTCGMAAMLSLMPWNRVLRTGPRES